MVDLYPETANKLDVIGHLEELRRRILFCLSVFLCLCLIFFTAKEPLFNLLRYPLKSLSTRLIFIEPAEAFAAYVKLVLLASFIAVFPVIVYELWEFLRPAFWPKKRGAIVFWLSLSLFLFFGGLFFAYYLALPAALNFLISFGETLADPQLTLGKYVSFFTGFLLISGLIFEIPLVLGLLTDLGVLKTRVLSQKRPIAFLLIMILAAIITPTQDVFNMMLFGIPMYLLYEIGLLLSFIIEKRKH